MKNVVVVFAILAIGIIQCNTVTGGLDEDEIKKSAAMLLQIVEFQERDLAQYTEQKNYLERAFAQVKDTLVAAMFKHPLVIMLKTTFGESKIQGYNARECESLYRDKFDLLVTKYERNVRDSVSTSFQMMNKNAREILKTITTIKLNLKFHLEHEILMCKCQGSESLDAACPNCQITGEYIQQLNTISEMLDEFKAMADVIQGEELLLLHNIFSNRYSPQIWNDLVVPVFDCYQKS